MTALDLAAGTALSAAMTPGPMRPVAENGRHRVWSEHAGEFVATIEKWSDKADAADAAGIAWLATHRDELLRLAAVGQAALRRAALRDAAVTDEASRDFEDAFEDAIRLATEAAP